ncbi:MAG TPA: NADH:flavin oxidoreductase [Oligoflexus sp.]|uniref:NADH:flavin oxidoreductase n=1 Tax=Oligoflexus sp. TaxID=1971216 RepID=UPI002D3361DC|nr:NADH:flavin oxidoreductase [Oligoflexus sp.]HYX36198.1 NADH:flavin oxidoreductase [Oligoflexus sp.]
MTEHDFRLKNWEFSNGVRAKNRLIVPAMASETADKAGYATDATIARYGRLTEVGAAIVLVEYSYVHESGRSEPNQLGAAEPGHFIGLQTLADTIRSRGALAGIQLVHAGGKTLPEWSGGRIMTPGSRPVPIMPGRKVGVPQAMSSTDMELWRHWFASSTERAIKAGYDLIELHAAHGYGLNQWLSPLTNDRTDAYGGSQENRFRFLLEIVSIVREISAGKLLSVRIAGGDFLEQGSTIVEAAILAQRLEAQGVDIINVSSGLGGWRRPRERVGEGYLLPEARFIQNRINIPVIAVGGFETPQVIDRAIALGDTSFVAVGRAILEGRYQDAHLRSSGAKEG